MRIVQAFISSWLSLIIFTILQSYGFTAVPFDLTHNNITISDHNNRLLRSKHKESSLASILNFASKGSQREDSSSIKSKIGVSSTIGNGRKEKESSLHPLLRPGQCRNIWRTDPFADLPGKCFAGTNYKNLEGLEDVIVENHKQCRSLCCNLGPRCNTWQYQNSTNLCTIEKGFVRRGFEGADTPNYCDPYPPHAWNGKMVKTKGLDGTGPCEWDYTIPKQCFSFGPERMSSTGGRMNTEECEAACCKDPTCNSYQEYPGRGCYYGQSKCQHEEVEGAFEGGRKCVPKFCGGWEDKILGPNYQPQSP